MKTTEEHRALKKDAVAPRQKLKKLRNDELEQVVGGVMPERNVKTGGDWDEEDIHAKFIDEQEDEADHTDKTLPMPGLPVPEPGASTRLILLHF